MNGQNKTGKTDRKASQGASNTTRRETDSRN